MKSDIMMSCFGTECVGPESRYYDSPEDRKAAKMRNKQLNKLLKTEHRQDLKRLKILLLGTGESGKSTITKQMKIIHINGYQTRERLEKIHDIRQNIKESIVVILSAMHALGIPLEKEENEPIMRHIMDEAGTPDIQMADGYLEQAETLWQDGGVQTCYSRSHEYQLLDSAKYFLDRVGEIRQPDYIPSDQDILRCRVTTTSIQNIQFDVPDAGQNVQFSVYDVGGQRGERKKWIQVFDSVVAILFMVDCTGYDQTLREDPTKNRLLEALEIFEQTWKNRFLKNVSILLFMNKIDSLAVKVQKGRCIRDLTRRYPDVFPDYDTFTPTSAEKMKFAASYNSPDSKHKHKHDKATRSKSADINPDLVKTAVYIKHVFMKIVKGDIELKPTVQKINKDWHHHHTCEYFYTCAVDTNNIQHVLEGCRTIIIQKHLERNTVLLVIDLGCAG